MQPGKPYVQILERRNTYLKGTVSEEDILGEC